MKTFQDIGYIPTVRILGQSNAAGRAPKDEILSDYLSDRASMIWNGSSLETFSPKADGVAGNHYYPGFSPDNPEDHFGLSVPFIKQLEDRYGHAFAIFQYAIGGQALLSGTSASDGVGAFEPDANAIWRVAMREWNLFTEYCQETYGLPVRIVATIWCQGEADHVYVNANRQEYRTALQDLLDADRALSSTDHPFLIVMPVRYDTGGSSGSQNWVRYEHLDVVLSNPKVGVTTCALIPEVYGTLISQVTTDNTHLDGATTIAEGNRLGVLYAAMQDPSTATAPTSLASTPSSTSIDLTWSGNSREFIITVDGLTSFTTTSTSATINGLSPSTTYTVRVYSHSDSWDVAYDEINTTTTA